MIYSLHQIWSIFFRYFIFEVKFFASCTCMQRMFFGHRHFLSSLALVYMLKNCMCGNLICILTACKLQTTFYNIRNACGHSKCVTFFISLLLSGNLELFNESRQAVSWTFYTNNTERYTCGHSNIPQGSGWNVRNSILKPNCRAKQTEFKFQKKCMTSNLKKSVRNKMLLLSKTNFNFLSHVIPIHSTDCKITAWAHAQVILIGCLQIFAKQVNATSKQQFVNLRI